MKGFFPIHPFAVFVKIFVLSKICLLFSVFVVPFTYSGFSQCNPSSYPGNFIVSTNQTLGGVHTVTDTFRVDAGVTITVPTQSSGCGYIEVTARVIQVFGIIDASGAGNPGGSGGATGGCLPVGCAGIISCTNKDNCQQLRTDGGSPGTAGTGVGAGAVGVAGSNALGNKQQCNSFGDDSGRVGGAGGAGGGRGGCYAGNGGASGSGGNGSNTSGCDGDASCATTGGAGGAGGAGSGTTCTTYGTTGTYAIEMGSGGAGGGGGGRGRNAGSAGGSGGSGGGYVMLVSEGDMTVSGAIYANGSNGTNGGAGGSAGSAGDCCSDASNGCDEYTYTGAGGGGGGAGGGSGGGILLDSQCGSMIVSGAVETKGGNGGSGGSGGSGSSQAGAGGTGAAGGGGGGGRVKIFTSSCGANSITSTPAIDGGTGQSVGTPGTYYTGTNSVILTAGSISGNQNACSGAVPGTLANISAATLGTCTTFNYQWQEAPSSTGPWTDIPGATTASYTPLPLDTTTFFRRIVIAGACSDSTNVVTVTVDPSPIVEAGFGNDTICTAGNVLLGGSPTATGGVSPFTYVWTPSSGLNDATIANPIATVTTTTTYVLVVTGTNACTGTDTITVNYNALGPVAEAGGGGSNTLCSGGTIMLGGNPAASGGTSPYSYSWIPTTGLSNSNIENPIATITADVTYTLAVIDSVGCQAIDSVAVTFNASGPFSDAGFGYDSICTGGVISIGGNPTATGGVSPYTYSWMPSAGLSDTSLSNPLANITANTVYYVSVMDAANCQSADSVTLIYNPSGPFADAGFGADIICSGGTVLLGGNPTGTGGGSPYSYSWVPATGLSNPNDSNPIATVTAGITYVLTLTDTLGCQASDSVQISFDSNGPVADAGGDSLNTLCSGGGIILGGSPSATGGASPYIYIWTPSFGLNDDSVANPVAVITADITYTLCVIDSTGCQSADFVSVTYNAAGPFAEAGFGSDSLCTGGSVLLGGFPTATGGSSPYSYSWTPSFGLDSPMVENPIATVTGDTTYFVVVSDVAGCQNLDSVTIVYNPSGPSVEAGFGNDTLCAGPGNSTLLGGNPTATSGIAPYTYQWLQPAGLNNPASSNPTATVSAPVTYMVIVTDAANCMDVDEVIVNPQPVITINPPMPITCSGLSTTLTASGASSYVWMPGNLTGSTIVVAPGTTTTYTVSGTDTNSCVGTASITVTVPALINTIGGSTTTICYGDTNGTATVTSIGGTTPYSYLWSNGDLSATADSLVAGTYYVTVTDANGCTKQDTIVVNQPPQMLLSLSSTMLSCHGLYNAEASASVVSGGNTPYSFLWSDGQTTSTATGLDSGTYSVTVTDFIGCFNTGSVYAGVLPPMAIATTADSCHGWYEDGSASVDTVINANYPLAYSWIIGTDTVSFDSVANYLDTGTYKVIITDAIGCKDSVLVTVGSKAVKANFSATPVVGTPPMEVVFTDSSKGNIYIYSWNFGNNVGTSALASPTFTYNDSGTYVVLLTVYDDGICLDTFSMEIVVEKWAIPNIFSPNGDGKNDVFTIKNVSIKTMEATIYNRWGERIYSWSDMSNGFWDGRTEGGNEVPEGVYFYIISAIGLDGKEHPPVQGYVTLVR